MGADGTDPAQTVTDLHLDCYAILGVGPNADETVIHTAFETLAQRYDPEHFVGSRDEAERKLSNVVSAYAILSDPVRRRRYDLRRRIDALTAPLSANDAPRQKAPPPAVVHHAKEAPRSRRRQAVLPAVLGALLIVAIATAYQFSGRPKADPRGSSRGAPPVATDAKPAPITQPTAPGTAIPGQPFGAGASDVVTAPAAPQQETKRAPQKPAAAKSPPVDRAGDASPAAVGSESCNDVAAVLGLCKRRSTDKDK